MTADASPFADAVFVLVDIQNDYFPGGAMELCRADEAAGRAKLLLARFREAGRPVVHVRHEAARPGATFFLPGTPGADIHPAVAPISGEAVVVKHFPNSFRETALLDSVRGHGATRLVVAGMMTHMCVDATVRAAFDLGFTVAVPADACATRNLTFDGREVAAADVQAAFLAALSAVYATVAPVADIVR
jgi:nicotinamidase-related amidase